ncbi:MAG: zinc ribbon domain-containing protein [Deltaproteobacteria bacterium]|nr:zinc ribbon domain-containing protein [Deltaproteobacteria bacterium]
MPLYEFTCRGCGDRFEELVRNQSEAVTCPRCNSPDVTRNLSACAIHGRRADGSSVATASGCTRTSCAGCNNCSGH